MNKAIINSIDKKFYSHYPHNWDNKFFRKKILAVLQPRHTVLDLGAGAGYVQEMNFKNLATHVTGVDMDESIAHNPFLHHYKVSSVYDLSAFDIEKFDVIICNSVIEHIQYPEKFVAEMYRVLKPGGYFFGKTPNRNHYVPIAALLTPTSFHKWFNKKRGRPAEHTFPTFYKMNTLNKIRNLFPVDKFKNRTIETFEGPPSYLRINFIFYIIGWLYERIVTLFKIESLKMVIIFSVQKKKNNM